MQYNGIRQFGKSLPKHRYRFDALNKVFESSENDLVLDFSGKNGWTFITGRGCTFMAGDNCDFKTCTVSQNAKSIYGKRGNTFGPYFTSKKIMKEIKG